MSTLEPFKELFESEEHFRARMAKPEKDMFEAEEHFRERLASHGDPKSPFESDAHYARRTRARAVWLSARCITQHDGRTAARCDTYPDLVGYGADEHSAKVDLLRVIDTKGGWTV